MMPRNSARRTCGSYPFNHRRADSTLRHAVTQKAGGYFQIFHQVFSASTGCSQRPLQRSELARQM